MTPELYNLFNMCTQWDWNKRPTLANLYNALINLYSNNLEYIKLDTRLKTYNNLFITPYEKNKKDRAKNFSTIWKICKSTNRFDLLCRILMLLDLYPDQLTDYNIVGCIYIAYILNGYSLKEKHFDKIINKFYYDMTETVMIPDIVISDIILFTVEKLKWICYFQTPDTVIINYIIEKYKEIDNKIDDRYEYILMDKLYSNYKFYKLLFNIIYNQENTYTVYEICEHLFKEIRPLIEVE